MDMPVGDPESLFYHQKTPGFKMFFRGLNKHMALQYNLKKKLKLKPEGGFNA